MVALLCTVHIDGLLQLIGGFWTFMSGINLENILLEKKKGKTKNSPFDIRSIC